MGDDDVYVEARDGVHGRMCGGHHDMRTESWQSIEEKTIAEKNKMYDEAGANLLGYNHQSEEVNDDVLYNEEEAEERYRIGLEKMTASPLMPATTLTAHASTDRGKMCFAALILCWVATDNALVLS